MGGLQTGFSPCFDVRKGAVVEGVEWPVVKEYLVLPRPRRTVDIEGHRRTESKRRRRSFHFDKIILYVVGLQLSCGSGARPRIPVRHCGQRPGDGNHSLSVTMRGRGGWCTGQVAQDEIDRGVHDDAGQLYPLRPSASLFCWIAPRFNVSVATPSICRVVFVNVVAVISDAVLCSART